MAICTERANREQRDGETFDITAERDGRLLTFGAGVHFCLGANLATAELEEALAFLAPRMPGLAMDGEATLGGVEGIYGVESLPLRWVSGSSARLIRTSPTEGLPRIRVEIWCREEFLGTNPVPTMPCRLEFQH